MNCDNSSCDCCGDRLLVGRPQEWQIAHLLGWSAVLQPPRNGTWRAGLSIQCRLLVVSLHSSELTTTGTTLWYMNASAMKGNVSATAPQDPLPVGFSMETPGAAMKHRPAKDMTAAPSRAVKHLQMWILFVPYVFLSGIAMPAFEQHELEA